MESKNRFWLAPMAGYTDRAFRTVCSRFGAGGTITEMVSAKALTYRDQKTRELLTIDDEHRPCFVQLFGSDPEAMAKGAEIALRLSRADGIDLNMGCPVGKIVKNGEGSALMRDPELASRIIRAVKNAADVPVTVKFRAGFGRGKTAVEFGRMAEASGADGLCVHGRTQSQMYGGESDPEIIRQVKENCRIPVAASGDAFSAARCLTLLRQTGADRVMIARGALGSPWIFEDCLRAEAGLPPGEPTVKRLVETLRQQLRLVYETKGDRAVVQMRKHALWYLNQVAGAKAFKLELSAARTLSEFDGICARMSDAGLTFKTGEIHR